MLLQKGADVKMISEILEHADRKIIYDTYIHISEDQKKKAIEIIDDIA